MPGNKSGANRCPNRWQANQQALELSTQLYKSGLADFLHVLDSERSLYAAQDALVQSDQAVSLNLVQLYKASAAAGRTKQTPCSRWESHFGGSKYINSSL